jgi:hypothetical protein
MRRAIAAAVIGGLVLGGVSATPAFAAAHGAGKASDQATKTTKTMKPKTTNTMKTVVYEGYAFQVPASWPVYRLDEHPQTCVRYDIHAVYLGTPGANMRCPSGLVGRTQTVSFIPGHDVAAGTSPQVTEQSAPPGAVGGTELQRLPAVHGTITQNAVQHVLRVALGTAALGATVLGTYGVDPAVIEQVLSTLHIAPAGAASTAQSGSAQANSRPSSARAALLSQRALAPAATSRKQPSPRRKLSRRPAHPRPKAAPTATYTSWRGVPVQWPVEIVQAPPPKAVSPVSGFDSCTAPSLETMRAWRSAYAAVGVYIGGVNSACAQFNLSASWIRSAASMGWGILPTYVGPQAPCWPGGPGVLIQPASAAAEGAAAASDAVSDARLFGLGTGSPIYYDMEAYNGGTSCKEAVLTFLGAWDRQVDAAGYVSGVYSSQDSGITDMERWAVDGTGGFTPPDAIWIALWDGIPSLADGSLTWPLSDRSKQYAGNVNATVGGFALTIDKDIVGGPMARLPAGKPREPRRRNRENREETAS